MSNGDDEEAADAPEEEAADEGAETEETPDEPAVALESRLDDAAADLEAAETEADLDEVEGELDAIESDLADTDFPEPKEGADEEGDEDGDVEAEDPAEALEGRLSDLREELDAQRGPYVEDVADEVATARSTVTDSEWTEDGEGEAVAAVQTFLDAAGEHVDVPPSAGDDPEAAADSLETAEESVRESGLDPDDDAAAIADLVAAAETLTEDLDAAETWQDLTVREQLDAQGFYEPLTNENRKDFPPEWTALKLHARAENVEPLVTALEKFDSDFMEEYVYDQLLHLGSAAAPAFDVLHQRAQKRNKEPIRILGKIGDERAVDTLAEFVEDEGDAALQKVTLRALGEIGSEDATQSVATRLDAENDDVRSMAARSLGLIGDTRAIDLLSDVLEDDDETDTVRASAAWALRQIGTERALDVAGGYADDPAYLVQAEAEKAAGV